MSRKHTNSMDIVKDKSRSNSYQHLLNQKSEQNFHDKNEKFKHQLEEFFESHLFHMALFLLLGIDLSIVMFEIILILLYCDDIPHDLHMLSLDLVYISIGILGFFLVELLMEMYAWGIKKFVMAAKGFYVFDLVVVATTFFGEIFFLGNKQAESMIGLLMLFRLWRLVRVLHVTTEGFHLLHEEQMAKLKKQIKELNLKLQNILLENERLKNDKETV